MVHGVVYSTAGTRRSVVALDAATGELLWVHGEHEGERGAAAPRQLSGRGLSYWTDGREERILYVTPGYRLVALDAKTGEVIWTHSLREGKRAVMAPRQLSGRGVSYWTDGRGDERIVYVTTGYRLVELNAKTGAMISSFGTNGAVDLKVGVTYGNRQPIDLETGEIGLHSTPTVVKDVVIVGSSFKEGMTVITHNNTKGLVRAFDVKSGKMLWTFNTIPRPGEFGNDTWENESWAVNGNTGVWNQIAADEELAAYADGNWLETSVQDARSRIGDWFPNRNRSVERRIR
jgi:glucose dehydrogenase